MPGTRRALRKYRSRHPCTWRDRDRGVLLPSLGCLSTSRRAGLQSSFLTLNTADILGQLFLAQWVKNLPAHAGDTGDPGFIPGSGRSPWRRAWQPTPVSLPGEPHGHRILVGYSPWGLKESNMTERLGGWGVAVLCIVGCPVASLVSSL